MLNTNRSNLEVLTANNFPRPFTTDDLDEMEDIDESIGPLVQESGYITVMSMPQEGGILPFEIAGSTLRDTSFKPVLTGLCLVQVSVLVERSMALSWRMVNTAHSLRLQGSL